MFFICHLRIITHSHVNSIWLTAWDDTKKPNKIDNQVCCVTHKKQVNRTSYNIAISEMKFLTHVSSISDFCTHFGYLILIGYLLPSLVIFEHWFYFSVPFRKQCFKNFTISRYNEFIEITDRLFFFFPVIQSPPPSASSVTTYLDDFFVSFILSIDENCKALMNVVPIYRAIYLRGEKKHLLLCNSSYLDKMYK